MTTLLSGTLPSTAGQGPEGTKSGQGNSQAGSGQGARCITGVHCSDSSYISFPTTNVLPFVVYYSECKLHPYLPTDLWTVLNEQRQLKICDISLASL